MAESELTSQQTKLARGTEAKMVAFISWTDWQRLTAEQRRMVEMYAETAIKKSSNGISLKISKQRLNEILREQRIAARQERVAERIDDQPASQVDMRPPSKHGTDMQPVASISCGTCPTCGQRIEQPEDPKRFRKPTVEEVAAYCQ